MCGQQHLRQGESNRCLLCLSAQQQLWGRTRVNVQNTLPEEAPQEKAALLPERGAQQEEVGEVRWVGLGWLRCLCLTAKPNRDCLQEGTYNS